MEVKGEKLEIGYDGRIVVREMDITVKKGEITTIIALTAPVNLLC